jgi:hypothetical protein
MFFVLHGSCKITVVGWLNSDLLLGTTGGFDARKHFLDGVLSRVTSRPSNRCIDTSSSQMIIAAHEL